MPAHLVAARRDERGLVADVRNVGTRKPRGERRQPLAVEPDVLVQRDACQVDPEDGLAAVDVRAVDRDLAVKAP